MHDRARFLTSMEWAGLFKNSPSVLLLYIAHAVHVVHVMCMCVCMCVCLLDRVERVFGRFGHEHFCVTHAMAHDLKTNWGIRYVQFSLAPL